MFQILNKTPWPSGLAFFIDAQGAEQVTVVAKATLQLPVAPQGSWEPANAQRPVLYADEYFAEPGKSSLRYPSDVVLGKYTTDVGLIGSVYSPTGHPVPELRATLQIGALRKDIQVQGDRVWRSGWTGGVTPTAAAPFTRLPLRYERSFGGTDTTDNDPRRHGWHPENPIGTGFRLNKRAIDNHPLPNFEDPAAAITSWTDRPAVAGYGFIAPSWSPRYQLAGTYDDTWKRSRAPLLPVDFDLRYCQAAAPALQTSSFLQGGEPVRLVNLSPRGDLEFCLPKINLRLTCRLGCEEVIAFAELWTVAFAPDEDLVYLVFGKTFPIGKQPARMRFVKIEDGGTGLSS